MAFLFISLGQLLAQRQIGGTSLTRVIQGTDRLEYRASHAQFWVRGPVGPVQQSAYSYVVYDSKTGALLESTPRGHFTWALFRWRPGVESVRIHRLRYLYSESGTLVNFYRGSTVIHRPE